jgi:hypothetical protein
MTIRAIDKVKVEAIGASGVAGVIDNFTTMDLTNDMMSPSEASFELGDDGTWNDIEERVLPGVEYRVFVNDRLQLTGRVELTDIPLDPGSGSVVRYTVRTKLADAQYASADPKIRIKDLSIKEFLVGTPGGPPGVYTPLGYTEEDFIFDPNVARDLLSGEDTSGKGDPQRVDLDPLKEDQAKVNPPETIFAAADRHLRRHGLMHWDSPDGKIVVGFPNDTQDPIYFLRMLRGSDGQHNNVLSAARKIDFTGIPATLGVYGVGGGKDYTKSKVSAVIEDAEVIAAGFYRPSLIIAEGVKTEAAAERAARREMSARRKGKDAWEIEVDGFSHWNGAKNVNWGIDNVAGIVTDLAGGPLGAYYLHRTAMSRDPMGADTTSLSLLRRGIWKL